jgi:hypothetical protein
MFGIRIVTKPKHTSDAYNYIVIFAHTSNQLMNDNTTDIVITQLFIGIGMTKMLRMSIVLDDTL